MKPLYALHKNAEGKILDATASSYNFEIEKWLRSLSFHPGDTIEFGEKAERPFETPTKLEAVS